MLKIDKLKKQYKNFTLNCSMEVKEGMITGFVGPNGSGKSTTLKAVLGLIYIDGGDIQIFGKNVKDIKPEDKERIGVVKGTIRRRLVEPPWHCPDGYSVAKIHMKHLMNSYLQTI